MTVAPALDIVRLRPQQSDDPSDKALCNSAKIIFVLAVNVLVFA